MDTVVNVEEQRMPRLDCTDLHADMHAQLFTYGIRAFSSCYIAYLFELFEFIELVCTDVLLKYISR